MIHYLSREDSNYPIRRLCKDLGKDGNFLRGMTYEQLFYLRRGPVANYVFTDFDRLSPYEIEIACLFARMLREASPNSRILNDPHFVLERYPLLKKLQQLGFNKFQVTRLDGNELPLNYPVFIRLEDDCLGPDTGLLKNDDEFRDAISKLMRDGKSLKRRIAVEFCAEPDSQGSYRKYGAFRIGDSIIPQHILRSQAWNVKRSGLNSDASFAREELEYVRENPHQATLMQIFKTANIDFGRIDYGIADGTIQTFEINTNPTFPAFRLEMDGRNERREIIRSRLLAALKEIDPVAEKSAVLRFHLPRPCLQHPRKPRKSRWYKLFIAWVRGY